VAYRLALLQVSKFANTVVTAAQFANQQPAIDKLLTKMPVISWHLGEQNLILEIRRL
jgi:hypothetical protein